MRFCFEKFSMTKKNAAGAALSLFYVAEIEDDIELVLTFFKGRLVADDTDVVIFIDVFEQIDRFLKIFEIRA